jgi:hypothetical protein
MPKQPAGFLSYARFDDDYEEGRLTQLRQRLQGEIRIQAGWQEFTIFQDRADIHWGEEWKARLEDAIRNVTFFIPVVTPLYFRSDACREELGQFLTKVENPNQRSFIFPIYYVDATAINDAAERARDPLAAALANRQLADWRELRFESLTTPRVSRALADLAAQVLDAFTKRTKDQENGKPSATENHRADSQVEPRYSKPPSQLADRENPRIRKITEQYATLFKEERFYFFSTIPDTKLSNAYSNYAPKALLHAETPLCLVDNSVWGSGKSGCLLTDAALYYKNDFEPGAMIRLEDIKTAAPSGVGPWKVLRVNSTLKLEFNQASQASLALFALMINDIRAALTGGDASSR